MRGAWHSNLSLTAALLALATAGLVGCNGPKDSCEGTMSSYAGIINGQDFDDGVELFMPSERAKYTDRKIRGMLKDNWFGTRDYKFKFMQADVDKSGKLCIARTVARWDTKIRGKALETTDDYSDVFTLHLQPDGKWYIDVPGSQKLGGF